MHAGLLATGAPALLVDLGRSVREAFYMLWATLWALVLGFGLSGAIQAFVSRDAMQRRLGDHRPSTVARASAYGMVSSSCSYAASAMARSLFVRGADFLAAMVFMFASTNLVIELGIVLAVLIGWQFVAAEFVGGVMMITLLVALGSLWLRGRVVVRARAAAESAAGDEGQDAGTELALERQGWRRRMRSAGGWADAAGYTMSDLAMLRREMAVGFLVAGFLTVLVPAHLWSDVFIRGHGIWTSIENAAVGPFVAVISFVCSVGNVPLAAALWKGGISFGGVIAFIFADLIAFPLLLVYRRQYGGRVALRLLGLFWLVMSLAGFVTGYLFDALGLVPTTRPGVVVGDTLRWGWTTALDLAALAVFATLYWLYRNRDRLGGGAGYAKDPVCAMQVEVANAPARAVHGSLQVYFCSEHCRDRFMAEPEKYLGKGGEQGASERDQREATPERDPVCGMTVDPADAPARQVHGGRTFYFCNVGCRDRFVAAPEEFSGSPPD
ncbi:MAG TPA: permease [Acidimicrobiales bacterium]|nr:permease [Acidimicrobiales bacterium]